MKSLFRSLTQLQRAFEKSPYKSIDYFLEILLFTKVDVPKDVPNQNNLKTSNLQTLQNLQSLQNLQNRAALKKTEVKTTEDAAEQRTLLHFVKKKKLKSVSIKIQENEETQNELNSNDEIPSKDWFQVYLTRPSLKWTVLGQSGRSLSAKLGGPKTESQQS